MENSFSHEYFMQRCLQLAENGVCDALPNPSVGAVLVHDNTIIGEGFTSKFGSSHAEVNALQSVSKKDKPLISKSTLYVTLEPCNHYGKTPPCSDLIIENQIPQVVMGTLDPNPRVLGSGMEKLKDAGVHTIVGVLEKECRWSLRKFLLPIEKRRPYITLKWAESSNQMISNLSRTPVKITNSSTQILTHRLRAEHQGVLCGWKTIFHDEPQLNNRLWIGQQPKVIVIDLHQKLNENKYFQSKKEWVRIVKGVSNRENDWEVKSEHIEEILQSIHKKGIQSIFVEGGAATHQHFIDHKLWDECYVFHGDIHISDGLPAPRLSNHFRVENFSISNDEVSRFIPE